MENLTIKQKRFADEYLIDLNGAQAAIRAGYSENTAKEQASRLLTDVNLSNYIQNAIKTRSKELKVDADYVLRRLCEIDAMDALDIHDDNGKILPLKQWPKVWRTSISGLEVSEILAGGDPVSILKKIKWPDKTKNLELIGKHVNVQAWGDKKGVEIEATPLAITFEVLDAKSDIKITNAKTK